MTRPQEAQVSGAYASTGKRLLHYALDAEAATLELRGGVTLPENGQYAWPHPGGDRLYVACSNGSPGNLGDRHCLCAFSISADGSLVPDGAVVPLLARPIHVTTDIPGRHLLVAYNDPSGVTVHRLDAAGGIGSEVPQRSAPDAGIFAHQTRVTATNRTAILVTRGNDAAPGKPEDPGALKIHRYDDGELISAQDIAPGGGYGYGPRHVDFDRSGRRLFVSLERQNRLDVHTMRGDAIAGEPMYSVATLAQPDSPAPGQRAGTLHVHPNGRVLYVANRADGTTVVDDKRFFAGGENSVAVYDIADESAAPRLLQHADTRGLVPRTFAVDAGGRTLIAANSRQLEVGTSSGHATVPASLALFRIAADGRLGYVRKYDVDVGNGTLFWMGILPPPRCSA